MSQMYGLSLVLHDVSPLTWQSCNRLVEMIEGLYAGAPITLLIVPNHHRRAPIAAATQWRNWIDERIARGDEIALHGYHHLDEGPTPLQVGDWVRRRVLTAAEGEFSALDEISTRRLLERGVAALDECQWKARGFVPPAWQMPERLRPLLARYGFEYTSSHRSLYRLPSLQRHDIATLGFSVRAAWRRALSIPVNRLQLRAQAASPLLRVALHPADATHPRMLDEWGRLLAVALQDRPPVLKSELLRRAEVNARAASAKRSGLPAKRANLAHGPE